ncbi:MAG: anion permease, partial [Halioglobus sp.]|nr:anion permease [Halioglobus sp.]
APELIMVPAAMSASCAFMLPVATAPNSVVYGSGQVTTARMAREGIWLNLLGVAIISSVCYITLA